MQKAIIGKKVGMTQIFDADGKVIAEFISDARRAQELLTPSLSPTSSGRE